MRLAPPISAVFLAIALASPVAAQDAAPAVPPALAAFAASLEPVPAGFSGIQGRTYVPVYSSVMAIGGSTRIDFAVTLSIHNGSAKQTIVLERIDYVDTSGRTIEAQLDRPVALRPWGTVQIVVAQPDTRGGLGANFVVDWTAPVAGVEPIVEAVMIASHGTQGYSFLATGRRVDR